MTSSRFAAHINTVLLRRAALLVGVFLLSFLPTSALACHAINLPVQSVSTEVGSRDVEPPGHAGSRGSSDHCKNCSAQHRLCHSSGCFAMAVAPIELVVLALGRSQSGLNDEHLWLTPYYKIDNPPD